jgi:hypothetical protein
MALSQNMEIGSRGASLELDSKGDVVELALRASRVNLISPTERSPLLQLKCEGKLFPPDKAAWDPSNHSLTLNFEPISATAKISVEPKTRYIRFELTELKSAHKVDLVVWGPYSTNIRETVGEIVGVVRNSAAAVGIQALNPKTLGGFPTQDSDIEAESDHYDFGDYSDLPDELRKDQHYRGDTARYTESGSSLQAYCRNRDSDRTIENWGYKRYLAPAYRDGGVVGSKIALFVCPAQDALKAIGDIELSEGLPHPMLGGDWAKQSNAATSSYLIVDFSEKTIDQAIAMTKKAGLHYLYHSSPFETWGHFKLKPDLFPHGWEGFRACVKKANREGIGVGFHTLSNFITPNDPYVTPKPDPRLARVGNSKLSGDLDEGGTEIPVADPEVFRQKTPMSTAVVGEELIQYSGVSESTPWRLLNCKRGAWGSVAGKHRQGETIGKLMDHGYMVFLPNADLSKEVARNIAKLCNYAGTVQISLDGLEGNWSTGMGQYGRTLFTYEWFRSLAPGLRGQINDASNPGHFNWHIATRMNWGEPWYAGFRQSQTLYRFKNQLFFERNLLPAMLGWFAVGPETTLEDVEWMLARAAGYNAGFALVTSLASTAQLTADPASAEALKSVGPMAAILDAVNQWETARLGGAFDDSVRKLLRDDSKEFRLTPNGAKSWTLYTVRDGKLEDPLTVRSR